MGVKEINKRLSLREVLRNNEYIECFFYHLTEEFSVELLLAFIEFKQFHDLMMNDMEYLNNISQNVTLTSSVLDKCILANDLPQSRIVYVHHKEIEENTKRYLWIAKELCDKYVSRGAEFEINISYECKQNITYFVNKHTNNHNNDHTLSRQEQYQLFVLFDDASETLIKLMESSHSRCIKTNRYSPKT